MKIKFALGCLVALLTGAVTVSAHHSFAATYDESKTIEIKGKVVVFSFRNPHSSITVEVTTNGKKDRWAVEGPHHRRPAGDRPPQPRAHRAGNTGRRDGNRPAPGSR